jgi:hypothetical protein
MHSSSPSFVTPAQAGAHRRGNTEPFRLSTMVGPGLRRGDEENWHDANADTQ